MRGGAQAYSGLTPSIYCWGMTTPAPSSLHPTRPVPPRSLDAHGEASTRLHGRWLVLARIAWVVLVLPIFWLYGVDLREQSGMLATVNGWITFGTWNLLLPLGFVL